MKLFSDLPCIATNFSYICINNIWKMGTKEKLIERFLKLPKDFTFDELTRLFGLFGFEKSNKGATSGSRIEFVHDKKNISYIAHKPHPSNIIKSYVMKQVLSFISENKLIEEQNQIKEEQEKQK